MSDPAFIKHGTRATQGNAPGRQQWLGLRTLAVAHVGDVGMCEEAGESGALVLPFTQRCAYGPPCCCFRESHLVVVS